MRSLRSAARKVAVFHFAVRDLGEEPASARRPAIESGVRPSTGSVGDAHHNAMCESFFATLECELIDRRRFRSDTEARMAVFAFIEGFYHPARRHSVPGYLSPIEYERRRNALIKPP